MPTRPNAKAGSNRSSHDSLSRPRGRPSPQPGAASTAPSRRRSAGPHRAGKSGGLGATWGRQGLTDLVHVDEYDRRGEEREHLRHQQSTDDRIAQRLPDFGPGSGPEHERNAAEQRAHGGHQNRPEAEEARVMDRVLRGKSAIALFFERDVDQHDAILLHDAD